VRVILSDALALVRRVIPSGQMYIPIAGRLWLMRALTLASGSPSLLAGELNRALDKRLAHVR
jgi:hypothetical protein